MIELFIKHRVAPESDIPETSISVTQDGEKSDRLILTGFGANEGEVRISRADICDVINIFQKWQRGDAGREGVARQLMSDLAKELPSDIQFSPKPVLNFLKSLDDVKHQVGVDQLTEILEFARDIRRRTTSLRMAVEAFPQEAKQG